MIRKARAEGITAPIIMLTATGVVENEAAEAGANDFLIKGSFDTPALERAIRYAIGNAEALGRFATLNASLEAQVAERTRQHVETNAHLVEQIAARQRAEAALLRSTTLEALGRMTGLVAHDFNNILTALFGSLETLEKRLGPEIDPRIGRPLANAREAARRGERMMDGLLAFARRRPVSPQLFDVNEVLADADDMLRLAAGAKVTVVIEPGPDLPSILADRDQLERAIVNLVTNARDAVNARIDGRVEIATARVGDHVRIQVTDNGPGMPPDVMTRAFEPLFSTKPEGRGTGLGLAQVYGFAQATGGSAELENVPGAGLRVTLDLPAQAFALDGHPSRERDGDPTPEPAAPIT
jgi:signal transduction histidine kinase